MPPQLVADRSAGRPSTGRRRRHVRRDDDTASMHLRQAVVMIDGDARHVARRGPSATARAVTVLPKALHRHGPSGKRSAARRFAASIGVGVAIGAPGRQPLSPGRANAGPGSSTAAVPRLGRSTAARPTAASAVDIACAGRNGTTTWSKRARRGPASVRRVTTRLRAERVGCDDPSPRIAPPGARCEHEHLTSHRRCDHATRTARSTRRSRGARRARAASFAARRSDRALEQLGGV